jgi:hypothetical protein
VTNTPRIQRLRALADQIDSRPASAERDALLREVRARIVEAESSRVSTGWSPAPPPREADPLILRF